MQPGEVMHACNSSTWEAEAGYQVQNQPELHIETLPQKKKKKKKNANRCMIKEKNAQYKLYNLTKKCL
jgi:hypothetical protein